jgi:hypothetical protein
MSDIIVISNDWEASMPDLDILERVPAPGWRSPYRLLAGGASPQEVAHATVKSLCKSLRTGHGLPGIDDLADIYGQVASGQLAVPEALRRLRLVERATNGHLHTKIAAGITAQRIVELRQGNPVTDDPAQVIAESFCWGIVEYHLFGRARPDLVGKRFANHDEALTWEQTCREILHPTLIKVAAKLVQDPTAANLRAPRATIPVRRSTADLLYEPITV